MITLRSRQHNIGAGERTSRANRANRTQAPESDTRNYGPDWWPMRPDDSRASKRHNVPF